MHFIRVYSAGLSFECIRRPFECIRRPFECIRRWVECIRRTIRVYSASVRVYSAKVPFECIRREVLFASRPLASPCFVCRDQAKRFSKSMARHAAIMSGAVAGCEPRKCFHFPGACVNIFFDAQTCDRSLKTTDGLKCRRYATSCQHI